MVEFKSVTKEYNKIFALEKVTFKIERGEFISVVGPSGAGKSTLIKLLIREELPSQGRIIVAGRDITELRSKELPYYRRKIGVVFQDFKLLPNKTVYENIAFALEVADASNEIIREKVPDILERVGMLSKKDNFPSELSGGEKQRTGIARALVHHQLILFADEPTGNLD